MSLLNDKRRKESQKENKNINKLSEIQRDNEFNLRVRFIFEYQNEVPDLSNKLMEKDYEIEKPQEFNKTHLADYIENFKVENESLRKEVEQELSIMKIEILERTKDIANAYKRVSIYEQQQSVQTKNELTKRLKQLSIEYSIDSN